MNKPFLLLPALFAVMLISGCVTGPGAGQAGGGAGLVILEWSPSVTTLRSGEPLTLTLWIQNQGDATAKNIRAYVMGMDDWYGAGFWQQVYHDFPDLPGRDVQEGTPGGEDGYEWQFEAPDLPYGTTAQYEPGVRVYYEYETLGAYRVRIVSFDEFRQMSDQGKSLQPQPVSVSSGPLTMSVTGAGVVKVETDGGFGFGQRVRIPISIRIENIGGGVVRPDPNSYSAWGFQSFFHGDENAFYPVKIEIETPPGLSLSGDADYCSTGEHIIGLYGGGKTRTLTCYLDVTEYPEVGYTDKTITIKLRYPYYVEQTTTVTVLGQKTGWFG